MTTNLMTMPAPTIANSTVQAPAAIQPDGSAGSVIPSAEALALCSSAGLPRIRNLLLRVEVDKSGDIVPNEDTADRLDILLRETTAPGATVLHVARVILCLRGESKWVNGVAGLGKVFAALDCDVAMTARVCSYTASVTGLWNAIAAAVNEQQQADAPAFSAAGSKSIWIAAWEMKRRAEAMYGY